MKHIRFRRASNSKTGRSYSKIFLWTLFTGSVLLKVYFTILSLGVSTTISNLEEASEEVLSENRKIQRELVAKTSLKDLEEKAPELGFINQSLPVSVKVEDVFAQVLR